MLIVISPAKSLDFENPSPVDVCSQPVFLSQSKKLNKVLKKLNREQLSALMNISSNLADLNYARNKNWKPPFTLDNAKQAVLAFKGDVYVGMEAENFSKSEFNFAQKHLRILSGLYGMLKPLDLIQPYRLEMGTKLDNPKGKNLYEFWGNQITRAINKELKASKGKVLINLASNEYFKVIQAKDIEVPVITPVFKEYKNEQYKVVSFLAKKARGYMCRYIIQNKIKKAAELKQFDTEGYVYKEEMSDDKQWVFVRKQ